MKRILTIFLALACAFSAYASDSDSTAYVHRVGFDYRPGALDRRQGFFKGDNASRMQMRAAGSMHLRYSFLFPAASRLGKLYPTAYQGIGVAGHTFFNHQELGTPAAVYVFQGAQLARFGRSLSLDYEWNFGLSMGWHPYREADADGNGGNPYNLVTGTALNAYINAGLMLSWYPVPEWTLSVGLDMTHFSNGDTTFPNSGVNTIGARISAVRSFGGIPEGERRPQWDGFGRRGFRDRISLDLTAYGAWNAESVNYMDTEHRVDGKFGILGLQVNPLCSLGRVLALGVSLDVQYAEGVNLSSHIAGMEPGTEALRFYRPTFAEQFGVGLSVRAEFRMPIFSVNLGAGHNVIYRGEELGGIYNIVALKTFLTERLFLNVGLRIGYTEASNNLLLGLGWRFGNISKQDR